MEILQESGVAVVPLSLIQEIDGAIAITFDDGFANLEDHAFRVLAEKHFPATVFLVSGFCGHDNDWAGQSKSVPRLPLLSWQAVRKLSGHFVEWGAHTVTHSNIANIPAQMAETEIRESRESIEDKTGYGVKAFAYPYGQANGAARDVVSHQFEIACGTKLRYLDATSDRYELPRLDAYYFRDPERLRTVLGQAGPAYIRFRRGLREGRTWLSR